MAKEVSGIQDSSATDVGARHKMSWGISGLVYKPSLNRGCRRRSVKDQKLKILRITTVPISLRLLLKGQLKFISEHYEVVGVSSGGPELAQVAQQESIRTVAIPMTRKISPVRDFIAVVRLYLLMRREKPFIVHTLTPKAGLVGMAASFLAGVPHKLHDVAGLPLMESTGIRRTILEAAERLTYLLADRLYPNSFALKEFILQNGFCDEIKLKVIGHGSSNGIDINHFSRTSEIEAKARTLRYQLGIDHAEFVFCFIGRIVKDKGINELLISFDWISRAVGNAKLLLVGVFEPDLDPVSNASKEILNNNKNVLQCGWQEDVRPYLAASDVLVFPSYREGFPNVPMQACAMGLPSIVTNINGCNEIIQEGRNGLLIEPKNTSQLIAAMTRLMNDHELRQHLSANAREAITDLFEQNFVWNEILKEYKDFELQDSIRRPSALQSV